MKTLDRFVGSLSVSLVVFGAAATPVTARAEETFDQITLAALISNSVNVLRAHQYLLKAQLLDDYTGIYYGFGGRSSSAKFQMADGTVEEGGVTRNIFTLGFGGGRPATGIAGFVGGELEYTAISDYPNFFKETDVKGGTGQLIFHGGLSLWGVTLSGGVLLDITGYNADQFGRFYRGELPEEGEVSSSGPFFRPGTPTSVRQQRGERQFSWNTFIALEEKHGFSFGALLSRLRSSDGRGPETADLGLAALRFLAQPYQLVPKLALFGLGLDHYAAEVDAYGDRASLGPGAPPNEGDIFEIPIVADSILGTGGLARAVVQVAPSPLFRLVEAGYVGRVNVFQAGARAMVFRRAESYTPGLDLFAGVSFRQERMPGFSFYLTYTYNSPDTATYIPLPNASVIGLQLVFGNAGGLPPPIRLVSLARDA